MSEHTKDFDKWVAIGEADALQLREKNAAYGGSWKKRGGVGAFMMLARKWDRLEEIVGKKWGYDVFQALRHASPEAGEELRDTIGDLRRYLTLIEAECCPVETDDTHYIVAPAPVQTVQLTGSVHIGDPAKDPKLQHITDLGDGRVIVKEPGTSCGENRGQIMTAEEAQVHFPDYHLPRRLVPRYDDKPDTAHGFTPDLDRPGNPAKPDTTREVG